jgi:hypothetical protein
MADFPLRFRVTEYYGELGERIRAKRGYVLCEFTLPAILSDAFVDTAAPFSVVPHTLSQHLQWQPAVRRLALSPGGSPVALSWQGIPSELGTLTLRLLDPAIGLRSGPLQCLAKFPVRAGPLSLERTIVLGLSLFDENDIDLRIQRISGVLTGMLSVS